VDDPDGGAECGERKHPHQEKRHRGPFGVVGVRPQGACHFRPSTIADISLRADPSAGNQHAEYQHDQGVQRGVKRERVVGRFEQQRHVGSLRGATDVKNNRAARSSAHVTKPTSTPVCRSREGRGVAISL